MECVQERPRSTHRSRRRVNSESTVEEPEGDDNGQKESENDQVNTNGDEHDPGREIAESERQTLNGLKNLLTEQEEVFKTEQERFETRKQTAKERVTDLFESFRKLLVEKETELLDKIDSEYSISGSFFADFVTNIESEKRRVDELLDSTNSAENESNVDDLGEEIDKNIDMRNDILYQFRVPYLVLDEESINTVKNLSFGQFQENTTEEFYETESDNHSESEDTQGPDNNEAGRYDDIVPCVNDNNENCEQDDERGNNLAEGIADENEHFDDKERGACGTTGDEVRLPTAPPAEQEESPPPYWQAMGLEQPHSDERHTVEVPGYYDIPHSPVNQLPDNKLQLWHSLPIRRQHDRRTPLAVGLTWNHDRICLADKANMKIKFFFPNGQLITEMCFGGTDIHDVAFLEECPGESRYAVTSPKSRVIMIISIDLSQTPKIIRKLTFEQQYSCVSRGPRVRTLLGAEVAQNYGAPVVNMFTFTGQILLSITHTPSFNFMKYIKGLEVFGRNIIVLDWKLNSVGVFYDNGQALGEYRGTPNFPLINPLDMTLDNKGNILILNGEFSNIHVIDQHCNLVEIIKIPRNKSSSSKLISFHSDSQKLAIARGNGDIAIFTFENGYDCLPQRNLPPNFGMPASPTVNSRGQRAPEVLPLVEGMLPSTIEDIIMRQPTRNRSRQFHL